MNSSNEYSYDLYKDGITQGLLTRFLQCPEKHRLGTVEGLVRGRTSGALAFGSLVHDMLDAVYSSSAHRVSMGLEVDYNFQLQILNKCMEDSLEKDRKALYDTGNNTAEAEEQIETNYGMAQVLLPHYLKRWETDITRYDWQALELSFTEKLEVAVPTVGNVSIPVRGKIDGVFKAATNGKLWLFETKTKSRIEEEAIVDTLGYNLQVCLYSWAIERIYGELPAGVVYNLLRKPQLRINKKESIKQFIARIDEDITARPDFYFIRYQCVLDSEEFARWRIEFEEMVTSLVHWEIGMWHFRNPTACTDRYGACEFLGLCARGDTTGLSHKEIPFPELDSRSGIIQIME